MRSSRFPAFCTEDDVVFGSTPGLPFLLSCIISLNDFIGCFCLDIFWVKLLLLFPRPSLACNLCPRIVDDSPLSVLAVQQISSEEKFYFFLSTHASRWQNKNWKSVCLLLTKSSSFCFNLSTTLVPSSHNGPGLPL